MDRWYKITDDILGQFEQTTKGNIFGYRYSDRNWVRGVCLGTIRELIDKALNSAYEAGVKETQRAQLAEYYKRDL